MKNNKKILLAISLSAVILPFNVYSMDELTGNDTYKNHDTHVSDNPYSSCKKLIVDEIDAMEQNNTTNQQSTNKDENNPNNECKLRRQNGKIFDIKNTEQDLDAYKEVYYNTEKIAASSRMESDNSDNENLNYNCDSFDGNNNDDSYELVVTNKEYTQFKDNKNNPKKNFNKDEIGSDEELFNDCQPISSNKDNKNKSNNTINTGRLKSKLTDNKTNNTNNIASLRHISKSNLQYNIPKNNPLMTFNTNNNKLCIQDNILDLINKILGEEKYSKSNNNSIDNKIINIENLNSRSINTLHIIIYYSRPESEIPAKYIAQFINLLFEVTNNPQEKINKIVYNSDFLKDLKKYDFRDIKVLDDILRISNVQNFLKEKVRARYSINYSELLNQLKAIKYNNENCKKLLDIIVILTAFDNKSFGEFNQAILHANNTLEKQISTNELLALFSSSFFENYLKNDTSTKKYENLGNLIRALKDTIIQYALQNKDFNIGNIIRVINTIIENDKYRTIKNINELQSTAHKLESCNYTDEDIIKVNNNIQEQQNILNSYKDNQQNIINLLSEIKLAIKNNTKVINTNNKQNNIKKGKLLSPEQCAKKIFHDFLQVRKYNSLAFQNIINQLQQHYSNEQINKIIDYIIDKVKNDKNLAYLKDHLIPALGSYKKIEYNNKLSTNSQTSAYDMAQLIINKFINTNNFDMLLHDIQDLRKQHSNTECEEVASTILSIVEAADESSKLYPYKQKIINYLLYNEEETANNEQNKNIKNKSLKELISYCDNNTEESLKILTDELVLRKQELKNADITFLDEFIENLMNILDNQVNRNGLLYNNKDYIINKVIDV